LDERKKLGERGYEVLRIWIKKRLEFCFMRLTGVDKTSPAADIDKRSLNRLLFKL
jgi:hypothetical protein